MALITGVHHVALKCAGKEEFEKTIRFYQETLQMPIVRSWPGGIMLNTGNSLIEIFDNAEGRLPQGAVRHFALATADVDTCVARVKEAGYEVAMEPTDIAIPAETLFPARIAFCIGPVGEEIEFFCEK